MTELYSFRFGEPADTQRQSLVMFSPSRISLDEIAKTLKNDVVYNLVPKNVYIITFDKAQINPADCKNDTVFQNEFISYVGDINSQLHFFNVDINGHILCDSGSLINIDLERSILQSGMIELFKKHRGLITSSYGYHFIKPSGDHCDKFIRASNLLVSSIEVSFLAISLLPFLKRNIRRIYVDTSSIAYLVSIALGLKKGYYEDIMPCIQSFESYAALSQKFDFIEDSDSLVIISATTSGSLAKRLLETTSFTNSQIVTLFYTTIPKEQLAICDISTAIPGGIISRRSSDCPFCNLGSKTIRISGDQFLPENPKHELLVIKKTNFTQDRQLFFKQFAARNVLFVNKSSSSNADYREHFFIEIDEAVKLNTDPFTRVMKKNIRRYVSRDLSTVVVLEDFGSQAFSKKFIDYLGKDGNAIKWLTPSKIDDVELADSGSVIVIAGAITSGRTLLAISRKLRCISSLATIVYFVAFSKVQNLESFKQLEKDLCQGGHQLVVLSRCPLPRIKNYTKTAFDREYEILRRFCANDPFGDADTDPPALLSDRFKSIDSTNSDDQLFLSAPDGSPLTLRRSFAFWADLGFDDARLKDSSQADVYWTIQCVLHDLRIASADKGLATTYHTTLISPANFDRYNDGVIQASLLRAALPVELDYRVDSVFSRQMTDLILSVLRNWGNAQGEGALEFLMALWTQQLQLNSDHLSEIVKLRSDDMPKAMKFILHHLGNNWLY